MSGNQLNVTLRLKELGVATSYGAPCVKRGIDLSDEQIVNDYAARLQEAFVWRGVYSDELPMRCSCLLQMQGWNGRWGVRCTLLAPSLCSPHLFALRFRGRLLLSFVALICG